MFAATAVTSGNMGDNNNNCNKAGCRPSRLLGTGALPVPASVPVLMLMVAPLGLVILIIQLVLDDATSFSRAESWPSSISGLFGRFKTTLRRLEASRSALGFGVLIASGFVVRVCLCFCVCFCVCFRVCSCARCCRCCCRFRSPWLWLLALAAPVCLRARLRVCLARWAPQRQAQPARDSRQATEAVHEAH